MDPIVKHLQKIDEGIKEIVAKFGHVAVYKLRLLDGNEVWEREQQEGGFYIAKKNNGTCYALCVLNRLSVNDLIMTIGPNEEFEFEIKERFLIIRRNAEIKCIWFASDVSETDSFDNIQVNLFQIKRELDLCPPQPLFTLPSLKAGTPKNQILSRQEMKDSLIKLISDDNFIDTLHQQYVVTEQKKKMAASTAAGGSSGNNNALNTPSSSALPPPMYVPSFSSPLQQPVSFRGPFQTPMQPAVIQQQQYAASYYAQQQQQQQARGAVGSSTNNNNVATTPRPFYG